ncbi:hypothetical protein EFQ99_20930 [Rhizobium vallis]|uniref:Uncharacterized protein n=1 Tax=Rhizobium vallis TaxID=634290 RepID=A0A3S0R833_9HYPH|nr:hypothetical protein [Rhizobium vallis]RUM23731.1 hypothetical protein EFQ99_20930 [Rhizobium vallis]
MDYFTVEIASRAVASFRAKNDEEATHFFEAEDFRDDLTILESEGKPLWDRKATLSLRKATAEEASEVEHAYEFDDDPERTIDDEFVVFLVPVEDLTDGGEDTED